MLDHNLLPRYTLVIIIFSSLRGIFFTFFFPLVEHHYSSHNAVSNVGRISFSSLDIVHTGIDYIFYILQKMQNLKVRNKISS